MTRLPLLALASCLAACTNVNAEFVAPYANQAPVIDGVADEAVWQTSQWHPIDVPIIGDSIDAPDFAGRYKLLWTESALYLTAEITDDKLFDQNPDPLIAYWDDDCLEIFVDEDRSGGIHLNDYNAFAYHVGLDNQVSDIGPDGKDGGMPVLLNEHVESQWQRQAEAPFSIVWETKIYLYPDTFHHDKPGKPVKLDADKTIGFMLAYCDNDGSQHRENFIGSHPIEPVNGDSNRGYIDASVFAELTLVK